MRASALMLRGLLAVLLLGACQSPTGGGDPPPPPPPVTPVVTVSNVPASLEAGTAGRATFAVQNVTNCVPSSSLSYIEGFLVVSCGSEVVVSFTASTARVGTDSLVMDFTNATGGRLRVAYPVTVTVPPVPSGAGFVATSVSAETGTSIHLDVDVGDEVSCSIGLSPALSLSGAASLETYPQGSCPSRVTLNTGILILPEGGMWLRLQAQGRSPQTNVFRDSVWVGQIRKGLQIDSPAVVQTVNGVYTTVTLRSSNCSFLKQNPGVHAGTETRADNDPYWDPMAQVETACQAKWAVSGFPGVGQHYIHFRTKREDGTYQVISVSWVVTAAP